MRPRTDVITLDKMADADDAMSDQDFRRSGCALSVAQKGRRQLPHGLELTANIAAGPKAVTRRKTLRRILRAGSELGGAGKRGCCLGAPCPRAAISALP